MIDAGADIIGDPSQSHCVAIDARAPLYDGGICTRVDCVSLGVVVNRDAVRFYDEGEDFWPKRYAIWGRLVAHQPGQIGYSIIDSKAIGHFMPPVFPGAQANTIAELARQLGLDGERLAQTIADYNAACAPGQFDHTRLDNCATSGLTPAKTHWARPIDTPPYYGYALRPGITFTYLGLYVDDTAAVHFAGQPSRNLFVAGEMMAGNVLGKGYTAGVGCRSAPPSAVSPASKPPGRRSRRNTMKSLEKLIIDAQIITEPEAEVERVMQVCNACRYCEGF